MAVQLKKRTFTVDEYYKMAEVGILHRDDRVELIEGEIIEMTAVGTRHTACVSKLNRLLTGIAGANLIVRVQDPVRLSDRSEPEPDLAVVAFRDDFYSGAHPTPRDTRLLAEVADTSLAYDRDIKVPLYARAGVPEVWLVDLTEPGVTIYTEPTAGSYRRRDRYRTGDGFRSHLLGEQRLSVSDVLP